MALFERVVSLFRRNPATESKERPVKKVWPWRLFKVTVALIFLGIVTGIGGTGYIWFKYGSDLPDIEKLREYSPSLVTRLYDNKDELIAEYFVEKRILTPIESIPQNIILATIAVEDSSFFEHHGINVEGIIRAMWANWRAGHVVQGGSSITQQVVKQVLLTSERSMERKIREALLSLQVERRYTKNEILEIYLNHIYYGHGAYGVAAAAQTYFGKSLNELTLAEMAMISGLPKAPNNYSPYSDPEKAYERRRHALDRMSVIGAITAAQRDEATEEPFTLIGRKKPVNHAPWFTEHVRRYVEKQYGSTALYHEGLSIKTTIDLELQRRAQAAVKNGLEVTDKRLGYRGPLGHFDLIAGEKPDWSTLNQETVHRDMTPATRYSVGDRLTALVLKVEKTKVEVGFEDATGTIDLAQMEWAHEVDTDRNARWTPNITDASQVVAVGDLIEVAVLEPLSEKTKTLVLALDQTPDIQGALLSLDPRTGYVLAMVGGYDAGDSKFNRAVQARRQPGSSFKPLIYTAALEKGFTPATVVVDSPIIFQRAVTEFKGWKPMNFEGKFFGPTTVREAVTHSRNIVTIKVLDKIGVKYAAQYAKERFGIVSPLEENLSLALGASPVSLYEMVTAYATLANGGARPKPVYIKSVEDSDGYTLEETAPDSIQIIPPAIAYQMVNIMTNVVRHGTAVKVHQAISHPIAGKTGTTNNYIDAWFIGFTPDIVTGVWVGKDDNTPLGRLETGSRSAVPIWIDFMAPTLEGTPAYDFTPPSDVVFVKIDKDTGLLTRGSGEDALYEGFVDGTEPTRFSSPSSGPSQPADPMGDML